MNSSSQEPSEKTYQIVSEIGHGAQGSVYLVRDVDSK